MKLLFIIACCISTVALAQQGPPETAYVHYVDSLVNNDRTKTIHYPDNSACGGNITAHYLKKELIFIESFDAGERASSKERNFYIRNDSIVYTFEETCCLSQSPAFNYDSFVQAHTDSLGHTDLNGLPMNCVTVHVYHLSGEVVKTVDGEDVFGETRNFLEFREANQQCFDRLKKELAGAY